MDRFVYPYNFVPSGGSRRPPAPGGEAAGVGGDQSFRALDTYSGWSGRIEFTLENVSPLFVPDPERTTYFDCGTNEQGRTQYHRAMEFFQEGGHLAIPGSSLKGMLRSVVEAVSNSSFGVFTPPEEVYPFRKTDTDELRSRRWGRIARHPQDGRLVVQKLETAKLWARDTPLFGSFDAAVGLVTDSDRMDCYNRVRETNARDFREGRSATYRLSNVELWQLHPGEPHVRFGAGGALFSSVTVFTGATVSAGTGARLEPRHRFKSAVRQSASLFPGPARNLMERRFGAIQPGLTGVAFETTNVPGAPTGAPVERVKRVGIGAKFWEARIPAAVAADAVLWPRRIKDAEDLANVNYVRVLLGGTGSVPIRPGVIEAAHRATGESLQEGDVVRYLAVAGEVVEIGTAAVFKSAERQHVAGIARRDPQLLSDVDNARLSPASRLFGWTPQAAGPGEDERSRPVAGRVRVGFAWSRSRPEDTRCTILRILATPKPQYYPFYLRAASPGDGGSSGVGYYADAAESPWWPRPGRLRGRKFYLHQPAACVDDPEAGCIAVSQTQPLSDEVNQGAQAFRSQHNVTAALLPRGARFTGAIEHDCLEDHELGLLLWALTLRDDPLATNAAPSPLAHKLGLGKPLGLGSVQVTVSSVIRCDPTDGWSPTTSGPREAPLSAGEAERLVRAFKVWMVTGAAGDDPAVASRFDELPYVRDLRRLLRLDLAGDWPVGYGPVAHPAYDPSEGYAYFVTQRRIREAGDEQALCTPAEIESGVVQRSGGAGP